MKICKVPGECLFTYRIFVLFEDNSLFTLYEEEKVIENVKKNKNLGLLNFIGSKLKQ